MVSIRPFAAVLVLLGCAPMAAAAANDLAALRADLDALEADYAAKLATLESRIAKLESGAQTATSAADAARPSAATSHASALPSPAAAAAPPTYAAATEASPSSPSASPSAYPSAYPATTEASPSFGGARGGQSAFNPAISLILAGNYGSLSQDPGTYRIAGFLPNNGDIGPGERSFNLGESELTIAANVDPYFFANATAAITSDNEISIEEAYFRTTALHDGFTLKGGRFFSGLGYLNEIHAHAWDFVDQPLVYQAFFGGQLAQDGVQVKWLAPTDTFIELGAEAGNGDSFPGTHRNRNGSTAKRSSPTSAATSAIPRAGAPESPGSTSEPTIAPTTTPTQPASPSWTRSLENPEPGAPTPF